MSKLPVNDSSVEKKRILVFKHLFEQGLPILKDFNTSQPRICILLLSGLVFFLMLVYALQHSHYPFMHDSLYYWQFGDSFVNNGFSFINFSDGLRGYFFPFLLFLIKLQASWIHLDAKLLFYGYSALFFTALSIYIVPWAFHNIFRWKLSLFGRLLLAILLFFFWRGHFLYPMSDFPAFAFLLVGVALFAAALESQKVSFSTIFIGLCIGAALNIRPVYLVSFIVILPFLVFHVYKLGWTRGAQWLFLFLLGFGLILWPQFKINQTHFKVNSPLVLARVAGEENLFEKQLFWGLKTQKYEVNMGENYPSIVVIYNDPIASVLKKTNLLREKNYARYIKIMHRYPLEMSISLFRHMFNGLDVFFPTPYVRNIFAEHMFFSIINYTIWFLLVVYLARLDLNELDLGKLLGVVCLLSPVILAVPTAIEIRFFLPTYLLGYGVIAFDFDYVGSMKPLLRNPWNILRLLIMFTLWLLACFTVSSMTIANLAR